jgi:hypothetical protein
MELTRRFSKTRKTQLTPACSEIWENSLTIFSRSVESSSETVSEIEENLSEVFCKIEKISSMTSQNQRKYIRNCIRFEDKIIMKFH